VSQANSAPTLTGTGNN